MDNANAELLIALGVVIVTLAGALAMSARASGRSAEAVKKSAEATAAASTTNVALNNELQRMLRESQHRMEEWSDERRELKRCVTEQEDVLLKLRREFDSYRRDAERRIDQLQQDLRGEQAKVRLVAGEMDLVKKQLADAQAGKAQAERELAAYKEQARQEIDTLRGQVADLTETTRRQQAEIDVLRKRGAGPGVEPGDSAPREGAEVGEAS